MNTHDTSLEDGSVLFMYIFLPQLETELSMFVHHGQFCHSNFDLDIGSLG
jgi:hypothetical protein